mmetsp:Transcript_24934/g.59224  ORF Transcript_24934/g.59224 Transcript_24934/m.59224 type:complete len:315 (-) Transcript_24934:1620-2564(-)
MKKNFAHTYPLANEKTEDSKFSLTTSLLSSKPINLDDGLPQIAIRAVYYVNTKINEHYNTWIEHQLSILLQGTQSIYVEELYIVADAVSCTDEHNLHDSIKKVKTKHKQKLHRTIIKLECHDTGTEELFEYNGIHKLWEIGQTFSGRQNIAIYFHSKGITRAKTWDEYIVTQGGGRNGLANLTANVFSQMDRVLEAFTLFPFVDVVGWDCSKGGFVWYNFFYARGSYVRTVEEPITTQRRHYYEDWLRRAGLEPQQTNLAPNAKRVTKERPKLSYPPLPAGHCYGLAADFDPSAANIGYYFNKKLGRRVLVDRT